MDVLREDNSTDQPIDPQLQLIAQLRAERNRWFLTTVGALVLSGVLVLFCWSAFSKAELNQEIVYVKLHPNGAWEVIEYKPDDDQLYFKTTIDAALEKYAEHRYKVDPSTIVDDWGRAAIFMSPEMESYFLAKDGYDAWGKIDRIKKHKTKAEIEIRDTEHYDEVAWNSESGVVGKAIRSNVYLTRTIIDNGRRKDPEQLVLSIQWRLVDKKTLVNEPIDNLRQNPLGVEILSEQLKKERSSD